MKHIDLFIMILYFSVILFVGWMGSKKVKTSESYAVAERNLGFFMYLSCMAAVVLGGASTIGTAKLGYLHGISGAWMVIMLGAGIICLSLFLAKKIYGLDVLTISEMLSRRYKGETRLISAIVACTYTSLMVVTQIIGMGTILNVFLGWGLFPSILLSGGIVLFYTLLGGMWAITMTDVVQFVIMTAGIFFIMLPASLIQAGGWEGITERLPDSYFNIGTIGGGTIFQNFLLFTLGMIVGQELWQRTFTAKSLKIVKAGGIGAGIYSMFYAIGVSLIGMCAYAVFPALDQPQNAFAYMALHTLPSGLLGIVLASVISALMSTASGSLLASSTLLVNDIIKPKLVPDMTEKKFLFYSRAVTLIIGLFSIICALWIQDVLTALDIAYAILSGAMFFPIILGFFWRKATAAAAFWSILISAAAVIGGLVWKGADSGEPIMYGLAAGGMTMVLAVYALPAAKPADHESSLETANLQDSGKGGDVWKRSM
ncbi:sodium:solute symporter [Bacillus sonorensis]|uniref:Na+/solute symporter n=2 Tax=Bacillus sonorensis TaxID=119858 RepID=M5P4T1_9BACI|nr:MULTISPECIES: sodium:solute symporter [Bacillus]TWK77953.1 High-affinity proline transporter PutP [Bacillus paralicheniformis]ASB89748.1 Sodium/iodide cotransporter [Bacillus sonorensis]EME74424.1 Na+/solute symporter [Bacillus sonorensis L12]MCZ0073570.1 sodium:solute symporter [Bacillus sonorensis]MCZ0092192.1 sodium:solute symporter [Bacillus sonorensis]